MMNTINLKLYNVLKSDFHLSDEKARVFAEAINEVAENSLSVTEFKSVVKEDLLKMELKIEQLRKEIEIVRKEIAESKADIVKWMFAFWIGTVGIAVLLYFVKR